VLTELPTGAIGCGRAPRWGVRSGRAIQVTEWEAKHWCVSSSRSGGKDILVGGAAPLGPTKRKSARRRGRRATALSREVSSFEVRMGR
jgi:hypothetical protein